MTVLANRPRSGTEERPPVDIVRARCHRCGNPVFRALTFEGKEVIVDQVSVEHLTKRPDGRLEHATCYRLHVRTCAEYQRRRQRW